MTSPEDSRLAIVILAAGQGSRMVSRRPKVLHQLGGRSLLRHVHDAARDLEHDAIHVVYGHRGDMVRRAEAGLRVHWVEQQEQRGTGHAAALALEHIPEEHQVLILCADVPLIRTATLDELLVGHRADDLSLLTFLAADPEGYGRVLRAPGGRLLAIVEEVDADARQRAIREVNSGILLARARHLKGWLRELSENSSAGECYLSDCVALAVAGKRDVHGHQASAEELCGINDRVQLAAAERCYQRRTAELLMRCGTTLADPHRIDVRGRLRVGGDCCIDANVLFEGEVTLGNEVHIGPHCVIRDASLADGTVVHSHCVIDGAAVGRNCRIGPFARIRPETCLAESVQVGNFVEIKNSTLGRGSKVNHLSYAGDSELGRDSNIGAGVITCNYDGQKKHRTHIGDRVFVGSNAQLIAPVRIGDGATIGAGATITRDVAASALALSRVPQRTVANWKRPGNPAHKS